MNLFRSLASFFRNKFWKEKAIRWKLEVGIWEGCVLSILELSSGRK